MLRLAVETASPEYQKKVFLTPYANTSFMEPMGRASSKITLKKVSEAIGTEAATSYNQPHYAILDIARCLFIH